MTARRTLAALVALATVSLTACSPSGEDGGPAVPFPAGAGIQQGLSLAALRADGWSVCLDETYDADGTTIANLLAACSGQYLLLACTNGPTTDVLALAAGDHRTIVTQVDAATATAHHVAGTVGWYFTDDFSWGFFPAGQGVTRNACDWDPDGTQTMKDRRLCWNAVAGDLTPGYRCGAEVGLNSSATWRRIVLAHP